jgi:hypothetical protein
MEATGLAPWSVTKKKNEGDGNLFPSSFCWQVVLEALENLSGVAKLSSTGGST